MCDYRRVLSGEIRRGWQILIPGTYLSDYYLLCDYGRSKEIKDDDMFRNKHDSSILVTESFCVQRTVKIRRFSTIFPKISADLAVIHHANKLLFINSVYLTPTILGVVFGLDSYRQRLSIVVFNAFSPQEKFAVWKITAPGAEYRYCETMFLDEHSRRLVIYFRKDGIIPTANTGSILAKGFLMVAYELSTDNNTILNDGLGTIIYTKDINVGRCKSLGDNETIMGVVSNGGDPGSVDVITLDRTGIKRRQSFEEWLEISESERPYFTHVMESYWKLHIDKPTAGILGNSSRPYMWFFQYTIMSRCIVGAWYARTGAGILCKRTQVDSLKNLAAKAVVGMYPSEISGMQLRAGMKTLAGFDFFQAVTEEQPLSVEVNLINGV